MAIPDRRTAVTCPPCFLLEGIFASLSLPLTFYTVPNCFSDSNHASLPILAALWRLHASFSSLARNRPPSVTHPSHSTQGAFAPGGLGQQLADIYQRRLSIIHRGYGGYNTEYCRRVLPHVRVLFQCILHLKLIKPFYDCSQRAIQLLPLAGKDQPLAAICVWLGANDACLAGTKQAVSVKRYKENLMWMIDLLREPTSPFHAPGTVIFIIGCPPLDYQAHKDDLENRLGDGVPVDRTEDRTALFAQAAKDLAKTAKVSYVDAHSALLREAGETRDLKAFLSDGLHLTSAGYQVAVQLRHRCRACTLSFAITYADCTGGIASCTRSRSS